MQGDLKFSQEWTQTLRHVTQSSSVSVLQKAAIGWWDDRCLSMGAAIAFYAIFSLAPGLLFGALTDALGAGLAWWVRRDRPLHAREGQALPLP